MRIFGPSADRIAGMMDRLDVEPIEHRWVSRSIHSAQKKVEGMNFDARKHLVEYDDVMNTQRKYIYADRLAFLEGTVDTREYVDGFIREVIEKGVEAHCEGRHQEDWDLDGLVRYLGSYFPLAPGTRIPPEALGEGRPGLVQYLHNAAIEAYGAKEAQVGPEVMRQAERFVILRTIDTKWIDYLTQMEQFREGIGLQAYGQRDPLIEYKREAYTMFEELKESIKADIVANMFRVQVLPEEPPAPPPSRLDRRARLSGPAEPAGDGRSAVAVADAVAAGKVGRNDPCPCGSGLKYKRCHGR